MTYRPPSELTVWPNGNPTDDDLTETLGCPDCDYEMVRREVAPGLHEILIAHDDTCPFLLGLTKR